jgi:hypothetical protein
MKLPVIEGLIRRRILLNYRVAPEVVARLLPHGMRPQLHRGYALAGICLIRLERVRPQCIPTFLGITSENAAHRFAVEWVDAFGQVQRGVFIARRDTSSRLNHWAGGRLFPGEHHWTRFHVRDVDGEIGLSVRSHDRAVVTDLDGHECDAWPANSLFASLEEASAFYEAGSLGFSVTRDPDRLDGLALHVRNWQACPFAVRHLASSYFDDSNRFPQGSIALDHALLMRNVEHQWRAAPDFCCREPNTGARQLPTCSLARALGQCV